METARAQIVESRARPLAWRLRVEALRRVLTHARRVGALAGIVRFYQRSPLRSAVRRSGILGVLPGNAAASEATLPDLPDRRFIPPARQDGLNRNVAMLVGCVMPEMYPHAHEATVRVLNRLGYQVVFPEQQTCCGALSLHGGDRCFARDLARRNIDAFLEANVEAVIVNSAGCGSTMKEYDHLLADEPLYRARARRFAGMTRDVLEFVAEHDVGPLGEVNVRTTYQDSCHLVHAQKVKMAPRAILKAIPGLELCEMEAPDRCCGSAGLYSMVQPEMSRRLLDSKMSDVEATGASCIATSNPGCMSQLEAGLRLHGRDGEVVHVIELLDRAMTAAGR